VAKGDIRNKIRDLLGAFMFGGEASAKKVKVLSGGERTRLALMKLLLEPVNLLILDEPTNHLDLKSKDVLKEAIRDFDGTVIIVSHDRDFLDGLVERVYEFGGGKVREHLGGIYDWIRMHEAEQGAQRTLSAQSFRNTQNTPSTPSTPTASSSKLSYEEQKAQARAQKKREKELADAEAQVAQLESAIAILEEQMATEAGSQDMTLYEKHTKLKQQLTQAEERWMELMETEM
jgi:ATP-binding cassette subfamily F protein 3